jgi:DNA-binding MarR family transcriptional regulator
MSESRRLAQAILRFFVLIQGRTGSAYFRLMEQESISTAQYRALSTLGRGPLALTVKELAERISLSPPAASRMTDELVRRGWVTRVEDETDRRQKRVRIGPPGRAMLERLDEARLGELAAFLDLLDDDARADLERALGPVLRLGAPGTNPD